MNVSSKRNLLSSKVTILQPPQWLKLLMLGLWCCTFHVHVVSANILLVDSQETFRSRMDHNVGGQQLKPNTNYMARLQVIPGNSYLCMDDERNISHQNWNITVPDDGLPGCMPPNLFYKVALLVKKGICSYSQKAAAASKYIHPPGIVQFLIIDGDYHLLDDATKVDDNKPTKEEEQENKKKDIWNMLAPKEVMTKGVAVSSSTFLRQQQQDTTSSEITVAILLVSYSVGQELAEYISEKETEHVKLEGGSRVVLNTSKPSPRAVVFVWVVFCVCMSACACFCLSSSFILNMEEQAQATPTRPRRRRLTMEQVEANLPLGVFDGTRLVLIRNETDDDHDKGGQDNDTLLVVDNDTTETTTPTLNPISLDVCSICLDEYVEGERLRYLPCHHTFHAPCIHKWLTERSATCPLCKIDLYQEEDQEEEQPPRDRLSSWMSMPPEAINNDGQNNPSLPVETRWRLQMNRRGQALGAWGRRIFFFGQGRNNSGENTDLVEPLLATETQEQEQQRVGTTTPTPSDVEEQPPLVARETQADAL